MARKADKDVNAVAGIWTRVVEIGDWLELLVEVVGTRGWLNHD